MPEDVDVEAIEVEAVVLELFCRLSGFAFRGLALSFKPEEGVVAVMAAGLAENDKTILFVPSSLFRPSSLAGMIQSQIRTRRAPPLQPLRVQFAQQSAGVHAVCLKSPSLLS